MKIQLPIDTSAVSFTHVMPPDLVLDRRTKQHKADANGEPLYSIELLCIGELGGEVLSVKFPGTPPAGIRRGMPVTVTGPMVTDWAIGNRVRLTFRVVEVELLPAEDAEADRQARQWCATGSNR